MTISAVVVAALTGCSELGTTSEAGSGSDVSLEGPLLVISDPPSADAGAISGPLSYESGCVRVGQTLAVFPSGTAWDETAARLTFEGGAEAAVGDQISADAVVLGADELIDEWGGDSEVDVDVASQVRGCADGGDVAVFAAG